MDDELPSDYGHKLYDNRCEIDPAMNFGGGQCDKTLATCVRRFENMARFICAFPAQPVDWFDQPFDFDPSSLSGT